MKYFHLLTSLSNIVAEFVELIKELQNNSNFDFIFKNFDSSALIVDYNLHHYARFRVSNLMVASDLISMLWHGLRLSQKNPKIVIILRRRTTYATNPSWLRALIITALHTGMRRGEILDLKWPCGMRIIILKV